MKNLRKVFVVYIILPLFLLNLFPPIRASAAEASPEFKPDWAQERVKPKEVEEKKNEKPVGWCSKGKVDRAGNEMVDDQGRPVKVNDVTYPDGTRIKYEYAQEKGREIKGIKWEITEPGGRKITYDVQNKTRTVKEPGRKAQTEEWKEAKAAALAPCGGECLPPASKSGRQGLRRAPAPPTQLASVAQRHSQSDAIGSGSEPRTEISPPLLLAATVEKPGTGAPLTQESPPPTQERNMKLVTFGEPLRETTVHFDPDPQTTPERFAENPPSNTWNPGDDEGPRTLQISELIPVWPGFVPPPRPDDKVVDRRTDTGEERKTKPGPDQTAKKDDQPRTMPGPEPKTKPEPETTPQIPDRTAKKEDKPRTTPGPEPKTKPDPKTTPQIPDQTAKKEDQPRTTPGPEPRTTPGPEPGTTGIPTIPGKAIEKGGGINVGGGWASVRLPSDFVNNCGGDGEEEERPLTTERALPDEQDKAALEQKRALARERDAEAERGAVAGQPGIRVRPTTQERVEWDGEYDPEGEGDYIKGVREDAQKLRTEIAIKTRERKQSCLPDELWDWVHGNPIWEGQNYLMRRLWMIELYEEAYRKGRRSGLTNAAAHAYAQAKLDEWRQEQVDQFVNTMLEHLQIFGGAITGREAMRAAAQYGDEFLKAANASQRKRLLDIAIKRAQARTQQAARPGAPRPGQAQQQPPQQRGMTKKELDDFLRTGPQMQGDPDARPRVRPLPPRRPASEWGKPPGTPTGTDRYAPGEAPPQPRAQAPSQPRPGPAETKKLPEFQPPPEGRTGPGQTDVLPRPPTETQKLPPFEPPPAGRTGPGQTDVLPRPGTQETAALPPQCPPGQRDTVTRTLDRVGGADIGQGIRPPMNPLGDSYVKLKGVERYLPEYIEVAKNRFPDLKANMARDLHQQYQEGIRLARENLKNPQWRSSLTPEEASYLENAIRPENVRGLDYFNQQLGVTPGR